MLRDHLDNISKAIKINTDLNACGIIDSYNVPNILIFYQLIMHPSFTFISFMV